MTELACELCAATHTLTPFEVAASPTPTTLEICETCTANISVANDHADHWRCLTTSMWSEDLGVKVVAYRLLKQLSSESWAQDALDMLYIEEDTLAWAEAGVTAASDPTRRIN